MFGEESWLVSYFHVCDLSNFINGSLKDLRLYLSGHETIGGPMNFVTKSRFGNITPTT